jgi:hypothetical protein
VNDVHTIEVRVTGKRGGHAAPDRAGAEDGSLHGSLFSVELVGRQFTPSAPLGWRAAIAAQANDTGDYHRHPEGDDGSTDGLHFAP